MVSDNVVKLSDLHPVTFLVTDDEDKLEASEAGMHDPNYTGPTCISHDDWESIKEQAAASGQSVRTFILSKLRAAGVLTC